MKIIKITSSGEIDERAFSLLGASSKRNDNTKIGMFGSGLKYSLAYLLRKGIKFRVFSGYREVKFTTELENFRERSFNRIFVNGKETSLTTDMGMDWTHWFIIREIYCNALDESEGSITIEEHNSIDDVTPDEDFTSFYIMVDEEFESIIQNWNDYFSEKRKDMLYHDEENKIFVGGEKVLIYRKGIRCQCHEQIKGIFNYDLSWVKINESRIIADDWDFRYKLVTFLKAITDEKIIHTVLYNINQYWEKNLYWDNATAFSNNWKNVIDEKYLIPYESAGLWEEEIKELKGNYIIIPQAMIKSLKITFGDDIKVIGDNAISNSKGDKKIIENIDKRQAYLLEEAVSFLEDANFKIKYPIKIVKFNNPSVFGQADDDVIYLSEKLFNMGKRKIAAVIIEENEHNSTGYGDESREFQTHFIDLYLGALEDKLSRYL